MSKVFILGAGFSSYAGGPLIKEINDSILKVKIDYNKQIFKDMDPEEFEQAREWIDGIMFEMQDLIGRYLAYNFEELLSHFEELILTSFSERRIQNLPEIRRALLWSIGKILEDKLRIFREESTLKNPYDNFIHSLNPESDSILTLNYDIFLEQRFIDLFEANKIDFGFDYKIPYSDTELPKGFHESSHLVNNPKTGHPIVSRSKGKNIPLLKLNGSYNWVLCDKVSCQAYKKPKIKADYWVEETPIFWKICKFCKKGKLECTIVPPISQKEVGKYDHNSGVFLNLRSEAITHLNNATKIIVIGYSFPQYDTEIRKVLHSGLMGNRENPKLIYVSPSRNIPTEYLLELPIRDIEIKREKFEKLPEDFFIN